MTLRKYVVILDDLTRHQIFIVITIILLEKMRNERISLNNDNNLSEFRLPCKFNEL